MDKITLIISELLTIIVSLILFINGKRKNIESTNIDITTNKRKKSSKRLLYYIPIVSILIFLSFTFYTTYSDTKKLEIETNRLSTILQKQRDTLEFTNATKNKISDSLLQLKELLKSYVSSIEKHQKVVGQKTNIVTTANNKIENTQQQIDQIKKYNNVITDTSILRIMRDFSMSGDDPTIEFYCPNKTNDNFIDLQLLLNDSNNVKNIASLFLLVIKDNPDGGVNFLFSQMYLPQYGLNLFRIKNYLNQPNIRLEVGYILKSEVSKPHPHFQKKSCRSFDS